MTDRLRIQVVAAALADSDGRILIASRPPGKHLAGGWEFPGGKLQAGELPLVGLARELHEELGITLGAGPHRPLGTVRHSYSDRDVEIRAWWTRDYVGSPRPLDGQELAWCAAGQLEAVPLLPADTHLIATLRLPCRLTALSTATYSMEQRVTTRPFGQICGSAEEAISAASASADFIALTTQLPDPVLTRICEHLDMPVFAFRIPMSVAWSLGAAGINEVTR